MKALLVLGCAIVLAACTDPQPAGNGGEPKIDPDNPTGNTSGPWHGERGLNDTTTHSTSDDPRRPQTLPNEQMPTPTKPEGQPIGSGN